MPPFVDHDDIGVCPRQVLRLVCYCKPTVAGQRRNLTDFPWISRTDIKLYCKRSLKCQPRNDLGILISRGAPPILTLGLGRRMVRKVKLRLMP